MLCSLSTSIASGKGAYYFDKTHGGFQRRIYYFIVVIAMLSTFPWRREVNNLWIYSVWNEFFLFFKLETINGLNVRIEQNSDTFSFTNSESFP